MARARSRKAARAVCAEVLQVVHYRPMGDWAIGNGLLAIEVVGRALFLRTLYDLDSLDDLASALGDSALPQASVWLALVSRRGGGSPPPSQGAHDAAARSRAACSACAVLVAGGSPYEQRACAL